MFLRKCGAKVVKISDLTSFLGCFSCRKKKIMCSDALFCKKVSQVRRFLFTLSRKYELNNNKHETLFWYHPRHRWRFPSGYQLFHRSGGLQFRAVPLRAAHHSRNRHAHLCELQEAEVRRHGGVTPQTRFCPLHGGRVVMTQRRDSHESLL